MSKYTTKMVAQLSASAEWTYADCVEFATEHNLNARSVISKVKSLGLAYVPKPAPSPKAARYLKAEVVQQIAKVVGVSADSIHGLAKADGNSLKALLVALS